MSVYGGADIPGRFRQLGPCGMDDEGRLSCLPGWVVSKGVRSADQEKYRCRPVMERPERSGSA